MSDKNTGNQPATPTQVIGTPVVVGTPSVRTIIPAPTVFVVATPPTNIVFVSKVKPNAPLWYELVLFVSVLLMMCGVGSYLLDFDEVWTPVYDLIKDTIDKKPKYYAVCIHLVRGMTAKYLETDMLDFTDDGIDKTTMTWLVVPFFFIVAVGGIFGTYYYRTEGNGRINFLITLFSSTGMHMLFYLSGRGATKPKRRTMRETDDVIDHVKAIWVVYVICQMALTGYLGFRFVSSKGFKKSLVGGPVGVNIVKGLLCIAIWMYAVSLLMIVYSAKPVVGVVFVFTSVSIVSVIWITYTAITILKDGRRLTNDVKVAPNQPEEKSLILTGP